MPEVNPALREARERLIVALDLPSASEALAFVDRLEGQAVWLKVGLELYLAAGEPLVLELSRRGFKVFLDLKLHDIPNTAAGGVRSVAASGASLLTIHASGGEAMMRAAVDSAAAVPGAPRILAVTVLTSMDEDALRATGIETTAAGQVLRLATLAVEANVAGLVCSAQEVAMLRQTFGPELLLVVPGIRPNDPEALADDQRRTATPYDAIVEGASMLVVGRPVTQAAKPSEVVVAMLNQINQAIEAKQTIRTA